jgi:hypothetical protein
VGLKQKVQDPWHVGLLALSQVFSSASGAKYYMIVLKLSIKTITYRVCFVRVDVDVGTRKPSMREGMRCWLGPGGSVSFPWGLWKMSELPLPVRNLQRGPVDVAKLHI